MSQDIFGDLDTPDDAPGEGFDTTRPEPDRPAPKPERPDPHRDEGLGGDFFTDEPEETPIDEFFEERSAPEGHNLHAEDAENIRQAVSPNDYALMYGGEADDQSRESFLSRAEYDEPEDYDPDDLDVETIGEEARERGKIKRLVKVGGAAVLGGGLLIGATAWAVSTFTGSGDDAQATSDERPEWATELPEFAEGGEFNDQFAEAPVFSISTTGPTSWFAAGIAEFDEGELILYSNTDGEEIAREEIGDYEYIVEFRHDGDPVIGVRTEDGLTSIRDDGQVETFEFDGSIVVNGESPMIHDEDGSTHLLDFEEGITEFEVNNSLNTVGADDGIVYQVDPEDAVLVTVDAAETVNAEEIDIAAPMEGGRFVRWAGTGHGYVGIIWGAPDSEGLWLAIHDVETGEAVTAVEADDGTGYWEVGRGLTAATIDDYAISMITGEVLAVDDDLEGAYSHYAFTEDRRFFDSQEDDPAVYTEGARILGASGTTIFVRTATGDVAAYDRQGATA